jgi:phage terminase Nu1 subunit (DNA packaging protein)
VTRRRRAPERTMTFEQLGEALGLSRSRLERYVRDGCPCQRPDGSGPGQRILFSANEVRAWMADQGLTGKTGRPSALQKLALREQAERPAKREETEAPEAGKPTTEADSVDDLLKKKALSEARKEWFTAIKAQVQALREQGRVIDAEDVAAAWGQEGAKTRQALLALPARLAPRLVGMPEAALEREIGAAVRDVLAGLSADPTKDPG